MEDHDDWELGDGDDDASCPRCGKRTRPGLSHCTICGTRLVGELEADPGTLRTIGETMGRPRPSRQGSRGRLLRTWTVAVIGLVLVVAVLTWLATREEPLQLEDLLGRPLPTSTPVAPLPTPVATRVVVPTVPRVAPTRVEEMVPPQPTLVVTPAPPPPPRPTVAPRGTPRKRRVPPPPIAPPVVPEPEDEPTLLQDRPRVEPTEKPSLGTDLQEASRAYARAVEVHNQRVDEYNALADEVQQRNAWDDGPESIALRRRLDRAREEVESARVQAELLRSRLESLRARYR